MEHLIGALPELNDLPYFETKTEANIQLIREVKKKLKHEVTVLDETKLQTIAKPMAHKMTMLKPNLVSKLETYVPIKLSLMLTMMVFIGNLLLHALAIFLYHKFAIVRKLTPKFLHLQSIIDEKNQSTNQTSRSPSTADLTNLATESVALGRQMLATRRTMSNKSIQQPQNQELEMPTRCTFYNDVTARAAESQG